MSLLKFTKENFDEIVSNATTPVLVDFFATWCGPCMMLAPTIEEIANDDACNAVIGKVDVDEQPELATRFSINVIPTLIVIKDGKESAKHVGVLSKEQILKLISE